MDASIIPGTKNYSIENLTYGKEYTITAKYIFNNEVIMQGSVKVTLSDDEPVVNKNISVAPTQTNGGIGSIFLNIGFDNNSLPTWNSNSIQQYCSLDDGKLEKTTYGKVQYTSVTSGPHSVKVVFKDSSNYILYQFTETINVFDNLTTNRWVKNGNEPYLKSSYCEITKECVDKFAQKTFYVDSSRQTTNSSGAGYTTQSGTYFNPFVKVSDAVNRINAGSDADYTIYVKDGHSEDFEGIEFDKNISIETYKNAPGDGLGNATLKMQDGASTFLWINSNTKFSLKNFILDGNYVENAGDGGIIANFGNTTLINCELKNGKSRARGGAICNATGASITLENCNIHDCSSASSYDGGGIYNIGILTLSDCTISGNTAENGGGIYNNGSLTFKGKCVIGDESKTTTAKLNDYSNKAQTSGGGIYTTTEFSVYNGSELYVYYNHASNGGGIYADYNNAVTLSNAAVKYCLANYGGGVYIKQTGNASITCDKLDVENCTSGATCGGIYCNAPVTISNSKVLNCSGAGGGGGIYLSKSATLENVCVENCTSTVSKIGNGMNCNMSDVEIKGTTYFDSTSDVYLASNAVTIKVEGTLTPKDQNGATKDKVATIRPESYNVGNQVLTGIKVKQECTKFAVTPDASNQMWEIDSDGKLSKKN